MLDIRFIEQNVDLVKANCATRGYQIDVDEVVQLNLRRKRLQGTIDDLRRQSNELGRQWKSGKATEDLKAKARVLKQQEHDLRDELRSVEEDLHDKASRIPNLLDPRVPLGDENAFQTIRVFGEPPEFDFAPRTHEELGIALNVLDIRRATNAAKARFYCLKNEATLMRFALIRMFLEHTLPQGFELISPPVMAKDRSLFASGYLPFSEKDNFRLEGEDLSLV